MDALITKLVVISQTIPVHYRDGEWQLIFCPMKLALDMAKDDCDKFAYPDHLFRAIKENSESFDVVKELDDHNGYKVTTFENNFSALQDRWFYRGFTVIIPESELHLYKCIGQTG